MTSLHSEITDSINPADDFYNHVNQKWRDNNPIPAEKSRYAAFTELSERVTEQLRELLEDSSTDDQSHDALLAKQFYQSGMDTERAEQLGAAPIQEFLAQVASLKSTNDIRKLIIDRHSEGKSLVWSLGLDVDEKDSQRYVMQVSQSGLLLPDRDYYFETAENFQNTRNAYHDFLHQVFEILGMDDVHQRALNVYAIEQELAGLSNTSIENRDVDAKYNPYTFAQLAKQFKGFDWVAYQKSTGLSAIDGLLVQQPKFLKGAIELIERAPLAVWQDYLVAHSVLPYFRYLSTAYDELQFSFFGKVLTGAEKQEDRYKRVITNVTALLPEPAGKLYVAEHFDEASKREITDLVEHIQDALRHRIEQLEWMSDETKQKAYEKLDTFMPLLGYPDSWRSYDSLELGDDYIANIVAIRRFEWQHDLDRLTKPVDRKEWLMSPATVNAYYWPNTNGITFPAAILQPPFFDAAGDFAANYGGIGVVIGHEIIHGFDDEGSKYDKTGNLNSWWTDADRTEFDKRTQKLMEQYDDYAVEGYPVKGALTLGENIADLGGVLIAYDALQQKLAQAESEDIEDYTPEQRFYLSYARIWRTNMRTEMALQLLVRDPHAPAHLRVNGVVTNVDSWYEAFDVDEGDLYTPPADRIRIW